MRLIKRLKLYAKDAIDGGKIVRVGAPQLRWTRPLGEFTSKLKDTEWNEFEIQERAFRNSLTNKGILKNRFICKGDISKWTKVIKLVNNIFVKGGEFQQKKANGEPWNENLCKFCLRILKCMPHNPTTDLLSGDIPVILRLEKQISYITEAVQPFFTKHQPSVSRESVSRSKLTNLWLHNRKKALKVIKNDNKWPQRSLFEIRQEETEEFYEKKKLFIIQRNKNNRGKPQGNSQVICNLSVNLFTKAEIESVIKKLPDRKSPGLDGVQYEDVKKNIDSVIRDLVDSFNVTLINRKVPSDWKHDLVKRIPKKNFQQQDPTTLRDISLSSVIYKIFSRCIIQRILPTIAPQISFWQRAFMPGRNRQDLIFCLKTTLGDFKHLSTKIHILFIDFADAYGSVEHEEIKRTLREYDIPDDYCAIIEDIYDNPSFQVICGDTLSQKITITRGTKTGDPLSVIIFLMIINKVLQPAYNHALTTLTIENEKKIRPLPIQAYADDIALIAYDYNMLIEMIQASEPLFSRAGLNVKTSKCALFYERRSGNNWYKGKNDRKPTLKVQGEKIKVYKRNEGYKYLGKSLTVAGEDEKQIKEFIEDFKNIIDKIESCSLPVPLKMSAFNNMALAKILHHFDNSKLEEKQLEEMDSKISTTVKKMFNLYPKTTDKTFYISRLQGGLGIKKPSNVYRATRIAHLMKMLNHDDSNIQHVARESLKLDMRSRGVKMTNEENNFLGYELDNNNRLMKRKTYGGNSDWPDLLHHVNKMKGKVVYKGDSAIILVGGREINQRNLKQEIEKEFERIDLLECLELRMQGNFIKMENIEKKISHQIYYGWKLSDRLVVFIVRARMNQLPCNQIINMWNKEHQKRCTLCNHSIESVAHLLSSCRKFKDLYSRRHDRIVNTVSEKIRKSNPTSHVLVNKMANTVFPAFRNDIEQISGRKPDIVELKENGQECEIIEITVCFDMYMEQSYIGKTEKYKELIRILEQNGIKANINVLCFGSLGSVHNKVRICFKRLGLSNDEAKTTMKWCGVSNMINANIIWRERCKLLHEERNNEQ